MAKTLLVNFPQRITIYMLIGATKALLTVLDTGAGPNLIRRSVLPVEKLESISSDKELVQLCSTSNHRFNVLGVCTLMAIAYVQATLCVLWRPFHIIPRRFPRLDLSCLLKVALYSLSSSGSTLHLGAADSADSTLYLGTADSADSTLHLGTAESANSTIPRTMLTVLFTLVLLTVLTVMILPTELIVTILLTLSARSESTPVAGYGPFGSGSPGIPETSFDLIRSISLFFIYFHSL